MGMDHALGLTCREPDVHRMRLPTYLLSLLVLAYALGLTYREPDVHRMRLPTYLLTLLVLAYALGLTCRAGRVQDEEWEVGVDWARWREEAPHDAGGEVGGDASSAHRCVR